MPGFTRREWLLATACWAEVLRAQDGGQKFQFLDASAASEIEAVAETILPGDATPGAREAGVVWFIDGALAGYDKDLRSAYKDGLADLRSRAGKRFADLTKEEQIKLLTEIEKTDFFVMVRKHTVLGFFGSPKYGGNRNGAGAKLLGYRDSMIWSPPFGYYDREAGR
jgi:gluconate 2-dehydrogenase gamma chain